MFLFFERVNIIDFLQQYLKFDFTLTENPDSIPIYSVIFEAEENGFTLASYFFNKLMKRKGARDLSIVFFGTPEFAVASLRTLIEAGCQVKAVVTAPDKPAGRGRKLQQSAVKEYASTQNLEILQPEKLRDNNFLSRLREINADLHIVVAFRMLPELVWNMPPLGTINVHASLLPQYRGAAPINWAIIHGEVKTGVTTFRLKHEIDTGNILLQKEVEILPEDNAGTLYERLMTEGANLLLETVEAIAKDEIVPVPQSNSKSISHAPKLLKETGRIDWNRKSEEIHNLIRGLAPYPGAYTLLQEKIFKIWRAEFIKEQHDEQPGSYRTDNKTFLRFASTDGWIDCKEIQMEGKKRMSIADFLRGTSL